MLRCLAAVALAAALLLADGARVQRDVRTERFATAIVCEVCHSNAPDSGAMRDHQGRGIAPHDLWRSSMMANASRDPFFRAVLAAESIAAGEDSAAVEARCLRCHAPMASYDAGEKGISLAQLDQEFEEHEADTAALARDGVSCTLCHQIQPDPKIDGKFSIGEDREIFGPFGDQFGLAMHRVSKYWPVKGEHVRDSAHCGTCHASTAIPGETTYLEWRNSAREKTCQECHMPHAGRTRIAKTSHGGDIYQIPPRGPVGKHLFVGGNTLVPRILRDNIDALHVKAPKEAFDATIAAARQLLRERTARVSIEDSARGVDRLDFTVRVENLAGHKFPSGHASRRAWLRVRVRDGKGRVVFSSGEVDEKGRIGGAAAALPHFDEVRDAASVQVYEALVEDGKLVKDNRLLPKGWDPELAAAAAPMPVGVGEDGNFAGGVDVVIYDVPYRDVAPPYEIEVALLYQPISPRYLAPLFEVEHEEIERFRKMYEAAGNEPELVAKARLVVTE